MNAPKPEFRELRKPIRGAEKTYRVTMEGAHPFYVSRIAYESTDPRSSMYQTRWILDAAAPWLRRSTLIMRTRKEAAELGARLYKQKVNE